MKPSWDDAPEWANWLARDRDLEWFWFELEPRARGDAWISDGRSFYAGEDSTEMKKEPRP
jgi:hypothetical protein